MVAGNGGTVVEARNVFPHLSGFVEDVDSKLWMFYDDGFDRAEHGPGVDSHYS